MFDVFSSEDQKPKLEPLKVDDQPSRDQGDVEIPDDFDTNFDEGISEEEASSTTTGNQTADEDIPPQQMDGSSDDISTNPSSGSSGQVGGQQMAGGDQERLSDETEALSGENLGGDEDEDLDLDVDVDDFVPEDESLELDGQDSEEHPGPDSEEAENTPEPTSDEPSEEGADDEDVDIEGLKEDISNPDSVQHELDEDVIEDDENVISSGTGADEGSSTTTEKASVERPSPPDNQSTSRYNQQEDSLYLKKTACQRAGETIQDIHHMLRRSRKDLQVVDDDLEGSQEENAKDIMTDIQDTLIDIENDMFREEA